MVADAETAIADVSSGEVAPAYYTSVVVLMDPDLERVRNAAHATARVIRRLGFPGPPLPTRLQGADSPDDTLLPPISAADREQLAAVLGDEAFDGGSVPSVAAGDERRIEALQEALTAGTRLRSAADEGAPSGQATPETPAQALQRMQDNRVSTSYADKLNAFKSAGLLGSSTKPTASGTALSERSADAYSRFAGQADADRWALNSKLKAPAPLSLLAGSVIPATLQTGINAELPGPISALVALDVRDSATGDYVLIPQGARLLGTYGADVQSGQERLLVAWQRIQWPDGTTMDIGAMPATDPAGYAGLHDLVDTHFWRMLRSALLMSGVTTGVALTQGTSSREDRSSTVGGVMAQSLGQQFGELSEEMIRKHMNVAPTLQIRPGYRLNVSVTKDLVFERPYVADTHTPTLRAVSRIEP